MGYGSAYENYILIQVDKGSVIEKREYDSEEYVKFRQLQFEEYKKTDEYRNTVKNMLDEGSDMEFIDSFLFSFVINFTSIFLVDAK
jgi:hypothetical protein